MKKLTTILFLALTAITVAQTYNSPESMVYDTSNDRYLISNVNGNTIFTLSTDGELTNFVTEGLNGPKALFIVGDTLLSINHTSVQGFLLSDASKVMHIDVDGSQFMNGAAIDGNDNLFVTDMQKHLVFRINLKTGDYNVFVDGLNSPNGLHFDEANNRLLMVSWGGNAKIQAIGLTDSVLTDVVTTKMSNLDGICSDNCGNIYVSSWGKNAVYVYEPTFTKAPTKIAENLSGPADISIRQDNQTLLVPKFNANAVEIIELGMNCAQTTSNIAPANESTELETTVTVEWEAVEGATSYYVEYGTDNMFYSTIGFKATENLSTDLEELDAATTYFWRIAAIVNDTKKMFSEPWSFSTAAETVSVLNADKQAVRIYPNPCSDQLNFSFDVEKVLVLNAIGQELLHIKDKTNSLDLSGMNTGIYFVKFTYHDVVTTKKVFKK